MSLFVLLRVAAHRALLAAATLVVVTATTVLATLASFSGAVDGAALRHELGGGSAASAALVVGADVAPKGARAADEAVERGARETFDGLPVTVRKLRKSGPYALPAVAGAPAPPDKPHLTHFASLDRTRVTRVSGELPAPKARATRDAPVPVAVPQAAAEQLDLGPGDRLTLTDRLGGGDVAIRVTGVYRAADPADPYWQADALRGRGVQKVVFTTYGPLLVSPSVLASGRTSGDTTTWVAGADYATLTTGRVDALRDASARGPERLREAEALGGNPTVTTGLPAVLDRSERALLVSRSTLLVVSAQLVLLAVCALLLVTRLLRAERAGENELLRARGASPRRIAALAWAESLLPAVPAAVCAPLLAGPLTRLLAERSGLGGIGVRPGDSGTAAVWLVSAATALCCAVLVAPALAASTGHRGRAVSLPGPLRAGADIGLLVVAAVAYWQLQRQSAGPGTGTPGGGSADGLGADPLLVLTPALALLAGTVLLLRLMPLAARFAERRAAGGRSLLGALTAWQLSRRPQRAAGPVLLLVLVVAMGMLAVGQSASWDRSQRDRADFRTGASIRVQDHRLDGPGEPGRYATLPGVRSAAPAHRASLSLSGDRAATVLALDTRRADQRLLLRDDLADVDAGRLLAATRSGGPDGRAGLVLPEGARSVSLTLRLAEPRTGKAPRGHEPAVTVLLEDAHGLTYRLPAGAVAGGAPRTVTLRLDTAGGERRAAPAGPLAITGLDLTGPVPPGARGELRLDVTDPTARDRDGNRLPVTVPGSLRWRGTAVTTAGGTGRPPAGARTSAATAERPLSAVYRVDSTATGGAQEPPAEDVSLRLRAERPEAPRQVTGVATDAFLRQTGARPGDSVDVTLGGQDVRVRIAHSVRQLPTTGPASDAATDTAGAAPAAAGDSGSDDSGGSGTAAAGSGTGGGLLLDLRAVNALLARDSGDPLDPTEWWLGTDPAGTADTAAALRERPDADPADVLVRDETAAALLGDPLGAAPRAALPAVTVAAAALAAVGFAVGALGSWRERRTELAVLRALGVSGRQLARQFASEQALLIAVALAAGAVLGTLLTRGVVPLTVLTGQAARPVPEVLVELPVPQVLLLPAGVALLPLAAVTVIALRRVAPAEALRRQEDVT
ncbi:FtsX-like permease family protein [Streptomyces lycii]|uniref:FtsX-like permease family protein n=1 Tax=Streptomyces lycii TaxID=2654337 RepID=A0ABQ7FBH7_9ACTN|nr:FtsX-like permease family protein [Streptomyces lycii]KAF4405620.1 FtsX-like permease family protein [Streptomyces lycii]